MSGRIKVRVAPPGECNDVEIADFAALVMAGGEVVAEGLEGRVRAASCLAFLTLGCCLTGVAALKRPKPGYRRRVVSGSGMALPEAKFPYELGWVFVMPNARGRRFSVDLTRAVLGSVGDAGVFATSRDDNKPMHATLAKCGFAPIGKLYKSTRGSYAIRVFAREAKEAVTARK